MKNSRQIIANQIQHIKKFINYNQAYFIPGMQYWINIQKSISEIQLKSRMRDGCLFFHSFNIVLEFLGRTITHKKDKNKKEDKLSQFAGNVILYFKDSKINLRSVKIFFFF
jgi:hypothetical protein